MSTKYPHLCKALLLLRYPLSPTWHRLAPAQGPELWSFGSNIRVPAQHRPPLVPSPASLWFEIELGLEIVIGQTRCYEYSQVNQKT